MAKDQDISAAKQGVAITPADSDIDITRAVWIGGAGDLVVTFQNGGVVTVGNVPDGTLLPIAVKRIAAATTATEIIALY